MNLARYKSFVNRLQRDATVTKGVGNIEVFRASSGMWYDLIDEQITDNRLIRWLNNTLRSGTHWRFQKSNVAYFPLLPLDVVIVATFPAPPRSTTRQRFCDNVHACLTGSNNEYDASHDHLTGLTNRAEFDRLLFEEVRHLKEANSPRLTGPENTGPDESMLLLAIDIDYFKIVNDSFGHQYGDFVLRCIARRFDDQCKPLREESNQKLRTLVARPGGEEFLIAIIGTMVPEDELKFAEQVRSAIEARAIPDDGDLNVFSLSSFPPGFELPHVTERRITVSIGVASTKPGLSPNKDDQTISLLKNSADVALYRAKSSGRNQVVAFRDILSHYGRILEHHRGTDIAAVDLGRSVNLRSGQEFRVFHPRFSGREPFIFTDGRSQKRLGTYPRVSCGRLEVFDVQSEISFCHVKENRTGAEFPPGSILEAVPAGSISHLLPTKDIIATELATQEELENILTKLDYKANFPAISVFSLSNFTELLEQNGPAFVNQALALLFAQLKKAVAPDALIGQIAPHQLACVTTGERALADTTITSILQDIRNDLGGKARFVVGVFAEADSKDLEKVVPDRALKLAQYAVAAQESDDSTIIHFSSRIPQTIVYRARQNREIDRAKIDYANFVKLDLNSANVENQMALLYIEGNKLEEARSHINNAIAMQDNTVFHLNAGVIEYRLKNFELALAHYKTAFALNDKLTLNDYYRIVFAWVFYNLHRSNPDKIPVADVRKMLEDAAGAEKVSPAERARLRVALLGLSVVEATVRN
jgi:diguanylate cyclase (GGDEF)-like protein